MHYKRLGYTLVVMIMTGFVLWSGQQNGYAQSLKIAVSKPQTTTAHTIHSNERGLTFTLTTPTHTIDEKGAIAIAGLETSTKDPGAPGLPAYTTYVALPPEATIADVQIHELDVQTAHVTTVQPVPKFDVSYDAIADNADFGETAAALTQQMDTPIYVQDAAFYQQDTLYPPTQYAVSAPMYYRDWRLVQLTVYPIHYNPVSGMLTHAREVEVSLQFTQGEMSKIRPLSTSDAVSQFALTSLILNYEQGRAWRHLPDDVRNAAQTILPIGQKIFKIEINETGIYEITGADLQAAGMTIANVDPATIQMTYRGDPVAYQLIDNGDNDLDLTDKIRFYGWTFAGSRLEKQFIGDSNVFWLWANGTPTTVPTVDNEAGQGYPVITTFPESITVDGPEQYHFHTRTNLWDNYPNEPDAWYMDLLAKSGSAATKSWTYAITLPDPVPTGPDAQLLAEITIRDTPVVNNVQQSHVGRVSINSSDYVERQWERVDRNTNITGTVPITTLINGPNTFHYTSATTTANDIYERVYLNRITVDYSRQLTAISNQLTFQATTGSQGEFYIRNFTESNAANVLVWDITQPNLPAQINMTGNISQTGSLTYTYKVGRTYANNIHIIATTRDHVLTTATISSYTPPNLAPTGGADWVAITHADFIAEANRLAAHRSDPTFTNLRTQVVDINDVINEYGYGLPIPGAIHDFLTYALGNWSIAPKYVTIIGDATFDPLHLPCLDRCDSSFDPNAPQYVVTDLVFKDSDQGLISSDHTMVTLSGDDLLPDMAIGRIAANTSAEAATVVDKIILYETDQLDAAARDYHDNVLFVADMTDDAGNFCLENETVGALLPASFNQEHLCLPERTADAVDTLRQDMQAAINNEGVGLLNYRGHGSVTYWINGSYHPLTASSTDFWFNENKPTIILSADCLDGYFAYPGVSGLAESFLKLDDVALDNIGSVAHWSSTGLGTTTEHTALLNGFLTGLFENGLTAIGDAAVYAKILYGQSGFYADDELYSFTLQGDPAMQMYRPDVSLQKTAVQGSSEPGETAAFNLRVQNNGDYPTYATITDTLPDELSFVSASSAAPFTYTVANNLVTVNLTDPLAAGESATVTINTQVASNISPGILVNQATVSNSGLDLNLADNSDSASLYIFTVTYRVYLPVIERQP